MNVLAKVPNSLDDYLTRWHLRLSSDEQPYIETPNSTIYKVIFRNGEIALLKHLKIFEQADEQMGGAVMAWYGDCAATIYEQDEGAQLMEYLEGPSLLDEFNIIGDEESTDIIAGVVLQLHGVREAPVPPGLTPLKKRFSELYRRAEQDRSFGGSGSTFAHAAHVANELLETPDRLYLPLHGDLHHGNIVGNANRAWKVIDPKGIYGDPAYETANIFRNPLGRQDITHSEERILTIARRFARSTGYSGERILKFGAVHSALSAAWSLQDGKVEEGLSGLYLAEKIFTVLRDHRADIAALRR